MCDCLRGSHNTNSLLKELITMGNLMKFHTKDLPELMDRINRYSIGMDNYFYRLGTLHETQTNYPPYNLVQLSNVEYRLELALAGFKKEEINVYTQDSNSSLKDEGMILTPPQNTSIEEWLNDLSPELGIYQIRRKLDQLHLRMGYFR